MSIKNKKSIPDCLDSVEYLPVRTPEMAIEGGAEKAFVQVSEYRDGAIYVGHYSGKSEWERHPNGDEIVMALQGETTLILRRDGVDERIHLRAQELAVVPQGIWHRFENSLDLKVFTVTPQPTEHQLEEPEA